MSGRTDLAEVVRTLIDGRGDIAQSRRAAESARQFQRAADIAGSARPASISDADIARCVARSEEHTSELQSLMRISYAVFCLKKKNNNDRQHITIIVKKNDIP